MPARLVRKRCNRLGVTPGQSKQQAPSVAQQAWVPQPGGQPCPTPAADTTQPIAAGISKAQCLPYHATMLTAALHCRHLTFSYTDLKFQPLTTLSRRRLCELSRPQILTESMMGCFKRRAARVLEAPVMEIKAAQGKAHPIFKAMLTPYSPFSLIPNLCTAGHHLRQDYGLDGPLA